MVTKARVGDAATGPRAPGAPRSPEGGGRKGPPWSLRKDHSPAGFGPRPPEHVRVSLTVSSSVMVPLKDSHLSAPGSLPGPGSPDAHRLEAGAGRKPPRRGPVGSLTGEGTSWNIPEGGDFTSCGYIQFTGHHVPQNPGAGLLAHAAVGRSEGSWLGSLVLLA